MTTKRERFRAVMDLVDRALDLPPAERKALLDGARESPEIRAEAERLLEADERAGDFLAEPAAGHLESALSATASATSPGAAAGDMVGAFELVALIGKGGMGEVWEAERAGADFDQRVAVKLLPPAVDERSVARFRRERRILARLAHPRIARLLDGGITPEGRPWIAMERVEGTSLTEHCASRELDVDARLRLFAEVCDGVQFAHRSLIVHRDLKPSNVLVTPEGEPKLLDFGIAKLLFDEEEDEGTLTRPDERPMTLDYAAPEQIRGEPVTTASDVWSLGVILHELLTGVRPYRTTGKNRAETERAILAAAPSRPSTHVDDADVPDRPKEASARALRRRLRGDLDAIVLKAMRPDPKDRYASAEALGADVRRHLERAPVLARGDATGYLVRAMVRRHRVAFGVSALMLASLLAGLGGTLWQAHEAREQARRAEQAQAFLVSMLRAFDPEDADGEAVTQRDILARGETRLGELDDQPEVQARLLEAFAETWYSIGEYDRATSAGERALALERRTRGPRSIEVATTLILLGEVHFEKGELDESDRLLTDGLAIAREVEGPRGLTVARALNDRAGVMRRRVEFAQAETLRRQALDIYETRAGEKDARTLGVMNDLAVLLGDEGRFAESATLQARTCDLMTTVRGDANPDTLVCRCNLARDYIEQGRAADADTLLGQVYEEQAHVLGKDWVDIPNTEVLRARAVDALGRSEDALSLFQDAIARTTRALGAESPTLASIQAYESVTLTHLGRFDEAEDTARRSLASCRAHYGEEHAYTARAHYALGCALLGEGHRGQAELELRSALGTQEKMLGRDHADTARTRAALARATGPEK